MPVGSNIYMIRRDGQVENVHNTRVKYDSPLLIRRGDAIYLLSRLQLSFAGRYRIASSRLPRIFRDAVNIGLYFCTPKTTALSQIDRASFEMKKLVSITSCGDTGYCSFAEDGNRSFIYTYSSNMGKPNKSWIEGQMQKTSIYRFTAQW